MPLLLNKYYKTVVYEEFVQGKHFPIIVFQLINKKIANRVKAYFVSLIIKKKLSIS